MIVSNDFSFYFIFIQTQGERPILATNKNLSDSQNPNFTPLPIIRFFDVKNHYQHQSKYKILIMEINDLTLYSFILVSLPTVFL